MLDLKKKKKKGIWDFFEKLKKNSGFTIKKLIFKPFSVLNISKLFGWFRSAVILSSQRGVFRLNAQSKLLYGKIIRSD